MQTMQVHQVIIDQKTKMLHVYLSKKWSKKQVHYTFQLLRYNNNNKNNSANLSEIICWKIHKKLFS